jgi:hypothetical protein
LLDAAGDPAQSAAEEVYRPGHQPAARVSSCLPSTSRNTAKFCSTWPGQGGMPSSSNSLCT